MRRPFEYIYEADNLRDKWNAIRDTAAMVNEHGYEYRPHSQNSNTFAFMALRSAGLSASGLGYDPVSGKNIRHKLPGREFTLSNPMNSASLETSDYDDMPSVLNRVRELEDLMGVRYSEYWRGPKAERMQQEYRDLVTIRTNHEKQEYRKKFSTFTMVP